ncbi:MAG TPA: periplasmic heavy metal sensor, partial [Catalimonadaceae bacterium]|nr:periplasmic heavy metal sensor [Catalimonadaceae bacterium]
TFAQRPPRDSAHAGKHGISNLTAEQKKKMAELRTQLKKEILPLKNQLGEKKARMQTLETADKADMQAINTLIDEIQSLQGKIMKMHASHRQEIRKMLTPEQRVDFDLKGMRKEKRHHKGRKGHHPEGHGMEE